MSNKHTHTARCGHGGKAQLTCTVHIPISYVCLLRNALQSKHKCDLIKISSGVFFLLSIKSHTVGGRTVVFAPGSFFYTRMCAGI